MTTDVATHFHRPPSRPPATTAMASFFLPGTGRVTPRVFVATDLSERADEAIRQGDAWARALCAELIVGHVVPDFVGMHALFPERRLPRQEMLSTLYERARAAVTSRVRELTGRAGEEALRVELGLGSPERGILSMARDCDADLIVVGDGGAGAVARALFGRTAMTVLRRAHCPVLVARTPQRAPRVVTPRGRRSGAAALPPAAPVPPPATSPPQPAITTVAATDFSDPALPALRAATAFAKMRGQKLVFFHGVDYVGYPSYGVGAATAGIASPIVAPTDVVAAAEKKLHEAASAVGAEDAAVRVGLHAAAHEIVATAEAERASLVVVGTHGHHGLKRLALGSVAEVVARSAKCSVLVVRLAATAA